MAKHSDTMATCTYTVSYDYTPAVDPSIVNVQAILQTGEVNSQTYDWTSQGGIDDAIDFIDNIITTGSGTITTHTITDNNDGTFTILYVYVYDDVTDGNLMGLLFDSTFPVGAEVDCASTPCPPPDITQCDTCLELTVPACQDVYTITAGLTADTDYVVVMTDHFNNEYTIDVTSDANGDLAIDMTSSEIPQGFTTPEFSPVQIEVRLTADGADQAITNNSVEYPCVKLNFVYRTDATPIVTWFLMTDFGEAITNDDGVNIDAD